MTQPGSSRRNPIGHWKAKKKAKEKDDDEKKMKLGEYNQEVIQSELNKYNHKLIHLECCLDSADIKKKTVTIRLSIKQDNLKSLLSRIPKKFQFIAKMNQSEWSLTINDQTIDKQDSAKFVELLSNIKPVAVVKIVKTVEEEDYFIITVHYNDQQFDYKIQSDTTQWQNKDFTHLIETIRKEFNLNAQFGLYEDVLGSTVDIDDMDDIIAAFENDEDEEKENDVNVATSNAKTAHLFVKVYKQLKVIYGSRSFMWIPPQPNTEDEEEWNNNYDALLNAIHDKYSLDTNDIELQQKEDDVHIDIGDGDDLMATWEALEDNGSNTVAAIEILNDVLSIPGINEDRDNDDEKEQPMDIGETEGNESNNQTMKPKIGGSKTENRNDNDTQHTLTQKQQKMKQWFIDDVGLPQYFLLFFDKGYEDLSFLDEDIIEDNLVAIGIKKPGHRSKILKEIRKLNHPISSIVNYDDVAKSIPNLPEDAHDKEERNIPINDDDDEKPPQNIAEPVMDEQSDNDDDDQNMMDEQSDKLMDVDSSDEELKEDVEEQPELRIEEVLSNLGSNIGALYSSKKKSCFSTISNMREEAETDEKSAMQFTQMLRPICQKESVEYQECIVLFLTILGYKVKKEQKEKRQDFHQYTIKGHPNNKVLHEVTAKFHHLVNAMQDPITDIYHELNIKIPSTSKVMKHGTGIYDDQFIIFELPQILMENQQSSLVNKTVLNPNNLERFINFIVPGSSKKLCKDIYFEKLKPRRVQPIGLFGSRQEVLSMLQDFNAISKALYDKLIDVDCVCLEAGIHCILPIHLQKSDHIKTWDGILYLFYWSLPNSFDMKKMKEVKWMRKDPACLLSRVLYEISSTVCIQVSPTELKDFGVLKREKDELVVKKRSNRKKLNFIVEETKENHVMCDKMDTKFVNVNSRSRTQSASDTFILNSTNLTMYLQFFKQKSRTIDDYQKVSCNTEPELIEFLKILHKEWIIEWDFDLSYDAKDISCKALIPKIYSNFKQDEKQLKDQKLVELNEEKIKSTAKSTVSKMNKEIKQEFFNLYINSTNIKQKHKIIQIIVKDLGDQINDSLAGEVALYINMEQKKTSLPEIDYTLIYWRKRKVADLVCDTHKLINTHNQNVENIGKKFRNKLKDIEEQKKPKPKGKGFLNVIKSVLGWDDTDEKKEREITDEEWNDYKQRLIVNGRWNKDQDTKAQQIRTIQNWCNAFVEQLNEYKHKVYKADKSGSIIHLKTVKDKIKGEIENKYRKLNTNLRQTLYRNFKLAQQKKKHLKTATLNKLVYTAKNNWNAASYDFGYVVPKVIPPTYDMVYTYIDLPNIQNEMKTNVLKNMHYEIQQDHDLLFHYVMGKGDVIMFIRGDNEEMKTSETNIIVSNRMTLSPEQSLKILKRKRVLNVAFCESQKIFAILFEGELAFAVLMENARVAFTNKGCNLSDMAWYNDDIEFKAMLIQEVAEDKNIFVWFVDQKNYVRAFDLDTSAFDAAKEFDLDQKYDSFILSPQGSFLIGFKPQYKEDEVITAGNQADIEDTKEEQSVEIIAAPEKNVENIEETKAEDPKAAPVQDPLVKPQLSSKRTPTGRVQLHAFLLSEKRKLLYKIHSKSLTGYEADNEPRMTDDNRDQLDNADNVLLPKQFDLNQIQLNRLSIKSTSKSDILLLCCITSNNHLIFHPLNIQVSAQKLRIHKAKRKTAIRKITKLDYMEYMIEKFGSRAAVSYPDDSKLSLHTTYIITDECKDGDDLCGQIAEKICKSLYDKEKKHFKYLLWKHNVLNMKDERCPNSVLKAITNKKTVLKGDEFIKRLIIQIPIQIARGVQNSFQLMYNGEDDQREYRRAGLIDSYSLCKTIRFSAYDGLIKSWEGKIKVVTSMGKQSTGKSYMLNHLVGTKFDISGGRCTDGVWLSAKILNDTLYILCDFEGLGSFERTPQEDMLLATFNSAISNCTVFKCENRFDRSMEEMFNNFQSGVKIMSGSKNCFSGELLLVIKDIVPTGADAAVEDFEGHIERLAQESQLIKNDEGKTESAFFAYQMYKSGLSIIPYPPLANEEFFVKLNTVIQPAIDDINVIHIGGKQFLDHLKLIMSKLNIGDWAAMSDEHAKIRIEELRANLQNAVEAGAIFQPKNTEFGVTFKVDDDQNLLLLDGNKVITMEATESLKKVKHYEDIIKEYSVYDEHIGVQLLKIAESLDDAGLILGKSDSLKFLYEQFCIKIKRTHNNFNAWTNIFQCFLDIIYWRRAHRVNKYINDNTQKFNTLAKDDINALIQQSEISLNVIRDKMKICKTKCKKCFYLCLLCKNHEDDNDWEDDHLCYQVKHSCTELCEYCNKEGNSVNCGDKCGHSGRHNCREKPHTCGKKCSLSEYGGCQEKCNEESGHDEEIPCKCNAETHYCKAVCSVPICKSTCKYPYNARDHQHLCIQTTCPYKCQVKCWDEKRKLTTDCGNYCSCNNHAHHLEQDEKVNKNEVHICDKEHPCPHRCNEQGLCSVDIKRRIIEKKVFTTRAKSKIEYDAYAEVNAEKKRCCTRIPPGKFRHDGILHRCYSGAAKDNIHTCDEKCDSCGYYCQEKFGHYKESGSFHDCIHGNMRNTVFYATEDVVDIGDNRKYGVGDSGVAEMCNLFCDRLGRGHIHLELCPYEEGKCVEIEGSGRRHAHKKYKPQPNKPKDEVKHTRFWRRKKWKDPCLEKRRKVFDKCNFVCQHPSHKEFEEKKKEEDELKYCTDNLWHKDCKTPTKHKFKCSHPFSNAHVIFVCDISGSMSCGDGGNSKAEYGFIINSGSLNNRLGALYSAIHKFLDIRLKKGCRDTVSAVMTPASPRAVAANRVTANANFVRDYLLQFKPTGCENYGQAFRDANNLVNQSEETVIIFLCDGYSSDNGASNVTRTLKSSMVKKFSLFCITLGPGTYNNNATVTSICSAGGGEMVSVLSGNELGTTFTSIAKQMNTGTLANL